MIARLFTFTFLFFIWLCFPFTTFAATFSISNVPTQVQDIEEFSANVTLQIGNSAGKEYFLRAAFSHADTPTSYFGYTKNNTENWYNGTPQPLTHTQFFKVTMDSNDSWSGMIFVKSDNKSSSYKGAGDYNFKIGRYTASGSGPTWSDNNMTISITASAPTPTPSPTLSLSPTSQPPPSPTSAPSPSPRSSSTPLPQSTNSSLPPTQVSTPTVAKDVETKIVLGVQGSSKDDERQEESENATQEANTNSVQPEDSKARLVLAVGSVIVGIGFILWSSYSFFKRGSSDRIGDDG